MTAIIHTDFMRQHPAQMVLTVLGLSAVALIFLPFVDGEVPVDHFQPLVVVISSCVVLPFAISAGYLRWLATGGLSRWESAVGYALGLMVVALFSLLVWSESPLDVRDLSLFAPLALGLAGGIWFVIQALRHGTPLTLMALVAMQLAYLPFALGWLSALPIPALIEGDWADIGIGGYLAVLAVLVYTAQAALSVQGQPRLWLRLLPLGLVWAGWLVAGFTVGM